MKKDTNVPTLKVMTVAIKHLDYSEDPDLLPSWLLGRSRFILLLCTPMLFLLYVIFTTLMINIPLQILVDLQGLLIVNYIILLRIILP